MSPVLARKKCAKIRSLTNRCATLNEQPSNESNHPLDGLDGWMTDGLNKPDESCTLRYAYIWIMVLISDMVTQHMLRTHEGKRFFSETNWICDCTLNRSDNEN